MKKAKLIVAAGVTAAVVIAACAKVESTATNAASKRYFDAWVSLNWPDAPTIGDVVITNDVPGTGADVADSTWIFVKYTVRTLDGTVSETTETEMSQQIGDYDPTYYYGAQPWDIADDVVAVGIERAVKGSSLIEGAPYPSMKVGGKRSFIVPCWLGVSTRYDDEEDYLDNSTSSSNYIYDLEITGCTDDIIQWQLDSMQRYSALHFDGADTTSYGFYYIQLKEPDDTVAMSDTTVYINYIGRLLNGQVFDTNIKDTAKMYNLYSESSTYEPAEISWSEDYEDITMDDNSTIDGFAMALAMMNKHEKGICMFYSGLGYSYSGSGNTIPPYAPLIFEIELVDDPDDE